MSQHKGKCPHWISEMFLIYDPYWIIMEIAEYDRLM